MRTTDQILIEFASEVIKGCEHVEDPSLPSHLIRVRDAAGQAYIAKLHRSAERFQREHLAYTTWVASLGHQAPRMVAADGARRALLLTELPGVPANLTGGAPSAEQAIHRSAGELLRRLHDVRPAELDPCIGSDLADRLDHWIKRAEGLLDSDELRTLRRHAHALAGIAPLETTVCHLDYQPRNWIIRGCTVHLVDFEHARIDARLRDLTRLRYRHWTRCPELREAFFAGYGQELTDTEEKALRHFGAIEAVTSLVRAHNTGDAELAVHGRNVLRQLG